MPAPRSLNRSRKETRTIWRSSGKLPKKVKFMLTCRFNTSQRISYAFQSKLATSLSTIMGDCITTTCPSRPAVPSGALQPTTNAMLEFDDFYWWTNYPFGISGSGYFFNGQQWDPRCATVDENGLHMVMKQSQLPHGPMQWSSVELVLWGPIKGNPNNPGSPPQRKYPGFGKYLVAAQTPTDFNTLANNCCFGAFTYQFLADPSITNQHRELDMLECSRFGNAGEPTNAQFTLQPWKPTGNVHRITIQSGKSEITLVMDWQAQGKPVTFNLYYGLYEFNTLPGSPDITWTTAANQDTYIPNQGCQIVHFNLWRQPPASVTPSEDQHVTIKRFQYQPI